MLECNYVAPHAGAWIETKVLKKTTSFSLVAPHAGAWIETDFGEGIIFQEYSRSPCGSVD